MDYQVLFNIAVGIAGAALGWMINGFRATIERLDQDIRALPDKYISKSDFKEHLQRIENALEKIFEKLDHKQDK
jgi:hypothetical protein